MNTLDEHTQKIIKFCEERDWKQFHDPKDVAISLSLEASEVLEHFQWKSHEEIDKAKVGEELADVYYWVLLLSHYVDIDLATQFKAKMQQNEAKYPILQAKGKKDKYTAYQADTPTA